LKQVELLSTLIFTTFYRGGSRRAGDRIIPQWSYMPTFAFIFGAQWYLTNNLIFTPALPSTRRRTAGRRRAVRPSADSASTTRCN